MEGVGRRASAPTSAAGGAETARSALDCGRLLPLWPVAAALLRGDEAAAPRGSASRAGLRKVAAGLHAVQDAAASASPRMS